MIKEKQQRLRFGMVGGALDSSIGDIHIKGASLDGEAEFAAGSFSRDFEKTLMAGRHYGLAEDRCYRSFEEMARSEAQRPDGIHFVIIATPNSTHYPAAKAFLENGIHVVCDKPLTLTSELGRDLKRLAEEKGVLFAVTYGYTGYPMVKQAKLMIKNGEIGKIRSVCGQYLQGGMATPVEKQGSKQAEWRCDPKISGSTNCVGGIGTHVENILAYVTGLDMEALCADMTAFNGRTLDNDAKILVRYKGGAKGTIWVSQAAIGHDNDLAFIISGEKGTIEWRQEEPNYLKVNMLGEPTKILSRGNGYFYPEVKEDIRIAAGHVEGHYVAFANIYRSFMKNIRARISGESAKTEYPQIDAGINGVVFVEKCVESDRLDAAWVKF